MPSNVTAAPTGALAGTTLRQPAVELGWQGSLVGATGLDDAETLGLGVIAVAAAGDGLIGAVGPPAALQPANRRPDTTMANRFTTSVTV
jgi:hypothetical protein